MAVAPKIAEDEPPEEHLLHQGDEQEHQNQGGNRSGAILGGILGGDGVGHRERQPPCQQVEPPRQQKAHHHTEKVLRQPIHKLQEVLFQKAPEKEEGQGEQEGVVEHVGLRHQSLPVPGDDPLGPCVQAGEHQQIEKEEHQSPVPLGSGHFSFPCAAEHAAAPFPSGIFKTSPKQAHFRSFLPCFRAF